MNYQTGYTGGTPFRDGNRAEQAKPHTLFLQDRKRLQINGVSDVIRFDDLSAEISTALGDLIIEGEGLRIEVFDTEKGEVVLTGEIRTLDYYERKAQSDKNEKKRGFFGKR